MIDWQRVAELERDVGETDFAEIAGLFLEELRETVAGLEARHGMAERAHDLHGLKGSALNLGFTELAALCAAGEANPAAADPGPIAAATDASIAALCARFPGLGR